MLQGSQFIASKSLSEADWLAARKTGLSATTMAKAMTPSGYREVVDTWGDDSPIPVNGYMQFGLDNEPWLAMWAKDAFGLKALMPNDWLIRHGSNEIAIATPDLLSRDDYAIGEIKTTGKDWDKVPLQYVRQVQWQLYVTDAEECYFIWLLRHEVRPGVFVPAWFQPKWKIIERDEKLIEEMVETADKLWSEIEGVHNA